MTVQIAKHTKQVTSGLHRLNYVPSMSKNVQLIMFSQKCIDVFLATYKMQSEIDIDFLINIYKHCVN